MAEFCLECWNDLNESQLTEDDVILTEYPDLCEGCAEMKPVVLAYRKRREKKKENGWLKNQRFRCFISHWK